MTDDQRQSLIGEYTVAARVRRIAERGREALDNGGEEL